MSGKELKTYEWISLGLFLGILAIFTGIVFINHRKNSFSDADIQPVYLPAKKSPFNVKKTLTVTIEGAVLNPGIYQLPDGAKLSDLLKMASPLPNAQLKTLKKKERLIDGQNYVIKEKNLTL